MRIEIVLGVCTVLLGVMSATVSAAEASPAKQPGIVLAEFIYEKAPFPSCHASTIVESGGQLVAAWFGGTDEGDPDVGIWVAHRGQRGWSAPVEVVNGVQADGKRHPCWNPVLFQPAGGPLLLFYKVGPSPRTWWGMVVGSDDAGQSWSPPRRLREGILGPIKNKPVQLADGRVLCGSSTEHDGWKVYFEIPSNRGRRWERIGPVNETDEFSAIQPTLLTYADGRVQALCRSRQRRVTEIWSADGGRTWGEMAATELPNPDSGIDGVTLRDGRQLLVYNHTVRGGPSPRGREMLNVALCGDGKRWQAALVLENERGEFSYPAVIQTVDGMVHTTYTWHRRRVKHVMIDPAKLVPRDMVEGNWPQ